MGIMSNNTNLLSAPVTVHLPEGDITLKDVHRLARFYGRHAYPGFDWTDKTRVDTATEKFSKPRLYISPEGEGILANFANRTSRPYNTYRKMLPQIFLALGLPANTKARWSQHAGCSMCPCSPGFILDVEGTFDAWATIEMAAQEPTEEGVYRVAQIVADSTIAGPLGVSQDAQDEARKLVAEARS